MFDLYIFGLLMLNKKFHYKNSTHLMSLLLLIYSTFSIAENIQPGNFFTVGFTSDCNFRAGDTKIQDAIDSNASEIRIAVGTYTENIQINQKSAIIKGGYSTCEVARTGNQDSDPTATIIDGDNTDTVVRIFGSLDRYEVTMSHLKLTNGRNSDTNPGGGISALNANVNLRLNDITIDDNRGSQGGGIAIFTGTTNITAHNLMIKGNTASSGGGIFCDGSGLATIVIDGDETSTYGITGNIANNGNGGGVYLSNGCSFTSYVGTQTNTNEDKRGIFVNFASRNGGGLYVASESKAQFFGNSKCIEENSTQVCRGYNSQPVNISYNVSDIDLDANGSGAGIYVTGLNSKVEIYNGLIEGNNTQRGNAGAVFLSSNAILIVDSDFSNGACWSPGACSQFKENKASVGGAIMMESGSDAIINRTQFSGHLANVANIVHADGNFTKARMQGTLIVDNGDFSGDYSNRSLFDINNNASLDLTLTTIADNKLNNKTAIISNESASVIFEMSIVSETPEMLVYSATNSDSEDFYCLLVHESDSLTGSVQFITTQSNPEFIDRDNENYRLNLNLSPAIDYCNNRSLFVLNDLDNEERGFDWPQISNFQGPLDLGYDEQTDVIFKNGFE